MFQKDPTFCDTRSHFWQKWDFSLCITAISVVLVIDDICYSTCTALEQLIFSDNTNVYDVEKYFQIMMRCFDYVPASVNMKPLIKSQEVGSRIPLFGLTTGTFQNV